MVEGVVYPLFVAILVGIGRLMPQWRHRRKQRESEARQKQAALARDLSTLCLQLRKNPDWSAVDAFILRSTWPDPDRELREHGSASRKLVKEIERKIARALDLYEEAKPPQAGQGLVKARERAAAAMAESTAAFLRERKDALRQEVAEVGDGWWERNGEQEARYSKQEQLQACVRAAELALEKLAAKWGFPFRQPSPDDPFPPPPPWGQPFPWGGR